MVRTLLDFDRDVRQAGDIAKTRLVDGLLEIVFNPADHRGERTWPAHGRGEFRPRNQAPPAAFLRSVSGCPAGHSRPRRQPGGPQKDFAMSLLISVLITFVVVILVLYLVNLLPIDGRAKQIVRVIVIIIGILSLLRYLAVF
jgi:hypothetical protein